MKAGGGLAAVLFVAWTAAAQERDAGEVDLEPSPDAGTPLAVLALPQPDRPGPAETPARVQLSETMLSAYHFDNGNVAPQGTLQYDPTGSNYFEWLNKLQLDAAWSSLTAMVRVDSALYLNAPVAAPGEP